ncbi:MAG: tryptophan--tRNA ligase [Candidatus Aenigmarchaeota archaeon]|nr:tryptophan--tRNA ligase [Candidatus Aenigmarchaeota archaeon]
MQHKNPKSIAHEKHEKEHTMSIAEVRGDVDYEAVIKEFGLERMQPMIEKMKAAKMKLPVMYRRNLVVAHRDFGQIFNAMINKKNFAILTGINPSGALHFGNKMFVDQAMFMQENGGKVFIPISNDETYVFKKAETLEKATENVIEVISDMIALGLDPRRTHFFVSTRTAKVYELAVKLSTKTTLSNMKAIFGFNNDTNPGQIFYGIVQSAHILYPQLPDQLGPCPVVVPIGIDQDPYMRLVRDMAERAGFVKPSSTNHIFMPGLQGGKMSGSKPETCIYLSDEPEAARKKIMGAFSGGGASMKEHREHGGNPDIDVACQYMKFMFEEDDKKLGEIFANYRNGSLSTGEVKSVLADKIVKFLKDHQKKREKAKPIAEKILANQS